MEGPLRSARTRLSPQRTSSRRHRSSPCAIASDGQSSACVRDGAWQEAAACGPMGGGSGDGVPAGCANGGGAPQFAVAPPPPIHAYCGARGGGARGKGGAPAAQCVDGGAEGRRRRR
uniref:Uncharacterized protein n=1 Tax=Arundo donax TaxID=35708 RepID=A0A0A9G9N5_ARUDO